MIRSARACPVGLVLAAAAAAGVMVTEAPFPIRPLVILGFIGLCPGLSLVASLRIADWTQRLVLGITTSLAIDTVVGGISIYTGYWSPAVVLLILIAITLIGVALQLSLTSPQIADSHDSAA